MAENILPRNIEDEMRESYLNYAMSVIMARALPDVRDGLKPIHRRILYAMGTMGLSHEHAYKKSATIVGEVLGKYHPHGDAAVYETMVRLAQDFSLRYLLVDGQGNFGSVDGDPAAAMRYTEAKMTKVSEEMLLDIRKETVDFRPNFDESIKEPVVLPASFPNLLANGSTGIAVGMTTNIPPHNIREVCDAIITYIDNPSVSIDKLIKKIPGPDFPTGGIIHGIQGIKSAYRTGRGKINIRSKFDIEELKGGREAIIITEIPYQVNKANLVMKIADLVRDKKVDGVADLRDESDQHGMRIVVELKKGAMPQVILNQLFTHTQMQTSFGIILLALVNNQPKVLGLLDIIKHYVDHRKEVIIRRTQFDLDKAEKRLHLLEGLRIALLNIDEIIALIQKSKTVEDARDGLMKKFKLSQVQAQAILDMRLQKLVNLEKLKVEQEYNEVTDLIKHLKAILASEGKVLEMIKGDLKEISGKYGDDRKTKIEGAELEALDIEDLITREDMVITITNKGIIKRTPIHSYKQQKRGGVGVAGSATKTDEFIEHLFIASTHHYIVFVSNKGKAYFLKVHEIPLGSKAARGSKSIKMLLNLTSDEDLKAYVPLDGFDDNKFMILATSMGMIKKCRISEFANAKTRGVYAITLDKGDNVITVKLTTGDQSIVLCTRRGNALVFPEKSVRVMGRAARGIKGIGLKSGDELAGMEVVAKKESLLVITEKGFGKRVSYDGFTPHSRGTGGQIYIKITPETGEVAAVRSVGDDDELFAITSMGMVMRTQVSGVTRQGRAAKGVRVIAVKEPDLVVAIGCVRDEDSADE
ncbi:MAG: DNA gyrase subunit A [Spirochaetota bacterium]|nr:DNA gyrase subunit A [Spirochaetota bacterium]